MCVAGNTAGLRKITGYDADMHMILFIKGVGG